MALDAFKNLANSTLVGTITNVATTFTVTTGDGAKFPSTAFNATLWDNTVATSPDGDVNAEIVRVTSRAGDVFTIVRAQESTTGVAHNNTVKVIAGWTALTANKAADKTGDTFTGAMTFSSDAIMANGYCPAFSALQTSSATLTASSPEVQLWNPGSTLIPTLPLANAVPVGRAFDFININATFTLTVTCAGADTIQNGSANAATATVAVGARLYIRSDGVSKWYRTI